MTPKDDDAARNPLTDLHVGIVGLGLMGGSLAMALRGRVARLTAIDVGYPATWEGVNRTQATVLARYGITGMTLYDGSGLSRSDRVTARAVVTLLVLVQVSGIGDSLANASQPSLNPTEASPRVEAIADGLILESHPYGMAAGPDGWLWVADAGANDLLRVNPATGEIALVTAFDGLPGAFPNPRRNDAVTPPWYVGIKSEKTVHRALAGHGNRTKRAPGSLQGGQHKKRHYTF